jgi:hypothetical protein
MHGVASVHCHFDDDLLELTWDMDLLRNVRLSESKSLDFGWKGLTWRPMQYIVPKTGGGSTPNPKQTIEHR